MKTSCGCVTLKAIQLETCQMKHLFAAIVLISSEFNLRFFLWLITEAFKSVLFEC